MENKSPFDLEKRKEWFDNVSPWKRLMVRQNMNTILLLGMFVLAGYVTYWLQINNFPSQLLLALKACRDNGAIDAVIDEGNLLNVSDIDSVLSYKNIYSFCSSKGYDGGYLGINCVVNCYETNDDGWTRNGCFKFSDVWKSVIGDVGGIVNATEQ